MKSHHCTTCEKRFVLKNILVSHTNEKTYLLWQIRNIGVGLYYNSSLFYLSKCTNTANVFYELIEMTVHSCTMFV